MTNTHIKAPGRALRLTLSYVIVAGAWILFSDEAVNWLIRDPAERTKISIFKGWGFVIVTGGLLYAMLRHWFRQLAREAEKLRQAEDLRQEAWKRLNQSEDQLRYLSDNLANTMLYQVRVGPDGRRSFSHVSAGVRALHGCSPEQALADANCIYGRVFEGDRERFQREEALALTALAPFRIELRLQGASGQLRWSQITSQPRKQEDGSVLWNGIEIDITERKESERRILQLNRVLTLLRHINHCLVREKDPKAVLAAACRLAVEKGGFRMAWIGIVNAATQQLESVASAGFVEGYTDSVEIDLRDQSRLGGPAGQCLLSGQHLVCSDIEHDPDYLPWREEALRRGYRSSGGFPLKVDGQTVGVFSLYSDTPQFFNAEEVQLLDELAMDIGFAMEVSNREGERQRVVEELRVTQERYKVLFESAPDAVLLVAAEGNDMGRILEANDLASRSHGYLPGELIGKGLWDINTGEAAGVAAERLQRILADDLRTFEVEHRRKDGTTFPVEVTARKTIVDGRVCVLGFNRDITERKRVEAAHARLATVVEQAAETIVITDTRGTILYVNPAFEKTTGYTRAEALGQNPRVLKSGRQDEAYYRQMWEALGRGEVWRGHFINRHKNGSLYEEAATISPVRDAGNNIISYVAVKRDVTREVQLERQLLQAQKMEFRGATGRWSGS